MAAPLSQAAAVLIQHSVGHDRSRAATKPILTKMVGTIIAALTDPLRRSHRFGAPLRHDRLELLGVTLTALS